MDNLKCACRFRYSDARVRLYFRKFPQCSLRERTVIAIIPGTGIKCTNQHYAFPKPGFVLKGRLPRRYSGKAVFYMAVKTYGVVDVAHPRYLKGQEELIDFYADIPLDGFTWDEPGKGMSDMSCFKAGSGFMALFEKLHGYPLRPSLIYLDQYDGTPKAARVGATITARWSR